MKTLDTNVLVYFIDSSEPTKRQQAILPRSLEIGFRYSLSHWDSLLLAACLEAGVETLYSEDLQNGADYGGVRVLNPFV